MDAAAELRRLRYLTSMGVQPFVSKRHLPGAAPSQRMALRVSAASPNTVRSDKTLSPTSSVSSGAAGTEAKAHSKVSLPASLRETLAQSRDKPLSGRSSASTAEQGPSETSTAKTQVENQERFSLVSIVAGSRLWVEEIADGLLAQEQLALVVAIDRALRHPSMDSEPTSHTVFSWPIHGNSQLGLGSDEAAASLEGYLRRQLDDNACVELISLGAASAQRLQALRLPVAQRTLPSTRELLDQPSRKRELWMQLRSQ